MRPLDNAPSNRAASLSRVGALAIATLLLFACTSQHYYEGLKAGRRASCLEYPESEFKDCVDETNTSYGEYQRQRDEIIGN